jgi:phosphoglycerate dehydrogenase-like enzyme
LSVLAWSPHLTKEQADSAGVNFATSKEELFRNADIVSIHMVLSNDTHHLITLSDLLLMKPSAFLINTSRGPLIEENGLVQVLKDKRIAGAGLDVFDQEPLALDHPLRSFPNVTLTPHMGYVSDDAYRVCIIVISNINHPLDDPRIGGKKQSRILTLS